MPRRAFVADLGKAVNGVSIAGISEVQTGGDDGEFTFQCVADGKKLKVSALIPDLSEYPSSHTCMIFAPDDAPASVATTLANISELASAKTVVQVLELVSRKLESTDRDGDKQMLDSQTYSDGEFENSDSEVDEYFPDEDMVPRPITNHTNGVTATNGDSKSTLSFRERIRSDLLTAKACGFKVGHHGGLMEGLGCYVSLSCRISKLGISEEAMQAWQVEPSEYLVVIFHYPTGYKSMDSIKSYDATTARRHLGIRVGISGTYKPSMQEAVRAFTVLSKEGEKRQEEQQRREEESPAEAQLHTLLRKGFRSSFISRPLNGLLEERFSTLLNYRYNGMPWSGAEMFYNEHYGINNTYCELGLDDKYLRAEQVSVNYPALVTADHICETTSQYHSLPLVGMQFVLRHFVRCTEFCLICFSKMPDDLQAIKPYVCENPLCLYQYMSLGFGPSIEHEILSQPQVVDLLISFCYASARMGKLKDFPIGLSLAVPPNCAYQKDHNTGIQQNGCGYPGAMPAPPIGTISTTIEGQPIRYNAVKREIIFGSMENRCPLRLGDWIVLQTDTQERALLPEPALHCRVADASCYPAIKLSEPVYPMITNGLAPANRVPPPTPQLQTTEHALLQGPSPSQPLVDEYRSAKYYVYDQNFEELDEHYKREVVVMLLNILPSVADMKQYLSWKAQSPLSSWVDRIPPAALGLLRWIIASNRACIVQVESEGDDSGKIGEERLCGMSGWSQFRFAMGAPDKERRFLQAVRDTTQRLRLDYPTLFAWHGSPLANWHSIIREGLHFKDTSHGRAYGHGVYHSLDLNTSLGYSAWGVGGLAWPRSELMVTQALALNEIVNAPKEYVSRTPHLVVAQLDWIQTRYLFVKTATGDKDTAFKDEVKPSQCIPQVRFPCPDQLSVNMLDRA
jgi:ubiquitin-conjugating enzyme E2 Q